MEIPCYQVDAFASRPFTGNPAAVCLLERFLPDATMQAIAAENALSETAFVVPRADGEHDLRWFTPEHEVDLCGHATLASAHVLARVAKTASGTIGSPTPAPPVRARGALPSGTSGASTPASIAFHTRSGRLLVEDRGGSMRMDFPSRPPVACDPPAGLFEALGCRGETLRSRDLVVVLASSEEVRALAPDLGAIARIDLFAVCVTARGTGADGDVDFVSRFFAPREGVPEDPVTGSAHCTLAPLWGARLGRSELRARQVSRRGGELGCALLRDPVRGDRVLLDGRAVLVKTGSFLLPG